MSQELGQRFEVFYCETSFNVWKHDYITILQMGTLRPREVLCLVQDFTDIK